MSWTYTNRLKAIRDEYDAAIQSVRYVYTQWHETAVHRSISGVERKHAQQAINNLESTYTIRLFAEFEGILKDHLVSNHSSISFNEKEDRVDRLLSLVLRAESRKLDKYLRTLFETLRSYRNSVAHKSHAAVQPVFLSDAMTTLSLIVAMFPEPYKR